MTSRHKQFGIVLVVCCCLFLLAFRETGAAASHDITIKISGSNVCSEQLDTSPFVTAPVSVPSGDNVTFHGQNASGGSTNAVVTFPASTTASCGSPFQYGGCNTTINSGTPAQVGNDTFPYSSVTIGGTACNNPGSLGLIMR